MEQDMGGNVEVKGRIDRKGVRWQDETTDLNLKHMTK